MPLSTAPEDHRFVNAVRALRQRPVLGYSIALALTGLAVLTRWLIADAVLAPAPFVTFYPAILFATFLGGLGPGVTALVLSSAAGWFLFVPPVFSWELDFPAAVALALFVIVSSVMIGVITWLNTALDHILFHEQNIRTLMNAAPNGIIVADHRGDITQVNPAAERLFGYKGAELIGRSIDTLVPDQLRDKHAGLRSGYMKAAERRPMGAGLDPEGRRKNGEQFPVEVDLAPVSGGTRVMASVIDISERKKAQERQRILVGEVRHRAQNLLSVVHAIVRRTLPDPTPEKAVLLGRLEALARVNAMIADGKWQGASLPEIIERELQVFSARTTVTGCDIVVSPMVAQCFALILHELATNAAKYGALSGPQGQVEIKGAIERIEDKEVFAFQWIETGGPKVTVPTRKGFGTSVLADVARQFCQDVTVQYDPAGLVYSLRAQVSAIAAPLTDQPKAS